MVAAQVIGNDAAITIAGQSGIADFQVNNANLAAALDRNPILVTAMNAVIGYDKGAEIAKKAYAEGRPVREVAAELTDLTDAELDRLLDPADLTKGGIKG
jgi:fumarate hydratase class II